MAKKKITKRQAENLPPTSAILLACEGVSRSPEGKSTLYGVFDRFLVDDFKQQVPFNAYVKVKGSGKHKFSLDVLDESGNSVLDTEEPSFESELIGGGLQAHIQLVAAFKKPGEYELVFKRGRKILAKYPIGVQKKVKNS